MKVPKKQRKKRADLHAQHLEAMQSLDGYSAFLESVQSETADASSLDFQDSEYFSDFEDYAASAVQNFLETEIPLENTNKAHALGKHDCAAITCTLDGYIRQVNQQARIDFDLSGNRTLEQCGISLFEETDTSALLETLSVDSHSRFHIKQARIIETDVFITAAIALISDAKGAEPLFLVLFISPPDATLVTKVLAEKFGFTTSEADVARAFLDGIPLREIAELRKRSYTTIRNQFQSVLDKSGCSSQTALFRLSFSLLQLSEQIKSNEPSAQPTKTRIVTLPRPKGRVVELAMCGDAKGQAVLSFPSLFGHGITAEIEEILHKRGVLLISVMRPGFGGTSPIPQGEALFDVTAGDVAAVLNSLEIEHCPFIARASAARPFYNVLSRLPDRFSTATITNGLIPRNYIAGKTIASKWTSALMSVSVLSFPIAKLILGTGNRLLMRSKDGSFLKKMYQESASDCTVLDDPDIVSSIKNGVREVTKQGLNSGVDEIVDGFQDWSNELLNIQTKVTLYHGFDDPNVPISGVADFAKDHAEILTLVTENKGGGQLSYSHFSHILDIALAKS